MPWGLQFNGWRASFMQTCLISFIVWNLALADQNFLIYFKWTFLISVTIAGIYGIFLMKMEGLNPYVSMLSNYFGKVDESIIFSKMEARLDFSTASKIQSTMSHPMTWTLFLCFSLIIIWAMYLKNGNKMLWLLIGIVGFNVLISGVRTGIAALILGFIYFLIRSRNFKLLILTLLILIILTLVVQSNDSLSNLFASFTDIKGQKNNVSGSSVTMRLNQLQGAFNVIKGNELTGKGYGWTGYYWSLHGDHPVMLAFESLIFMVLCNSGFIGALIWIIFFLLLYRLNRRILTLKTDIFLMDTFIIVYAAYAIGTGEYGYMSFFAIFYSFLLGYFKSNRQLEIDMEQNQIKTNGKSYIKFDLLNEL
jgi:hypothetical protein